MNEPYVFAISDREQLSTVGGIRRVFELLQHAGYKLGDMSWLDLAGGMTWEDMVRRSQATLARAGITKLVQGHDDEKMRTWYKVYPRPEDAVPAVEYSDSQKNS